MLRSSWNLSAVGGYTDTIGRSAILSIAYHNVTCINAMPARDSNNKNQDCSYRGIEYRLCPGTQRKAKKLAGLAGACQFVWNAILSQCNEEYQDETKENPQLAYFSLGKRFTKLRDKVGWLPEYLFAIVRYALKYQADAWQRYFRDTANRPDFHRKHKHTDSFTATKDFFKIVDDSVYIQKIGWMKMRRNGGNPYLDGKPIEITVRKEGRYWKMSVIYKIPTPEKTENGVAVGIDLNTYNVAWTSSEGEQGMLPIEKPDVKEIRIRRYQHKLTRQQKGSNRAKITKRKIAKWKRKQKNTRKNQDH
ncbi:MAG: transposase, partial [Bacteroidetes bacterium]|nr:transposase [Bacteroidota bacterium]